MIKFCKKESWGKTVNNLKYRFLTCFLDVFGKGPYKSIKGKAEPMGPGKPLEVKEKTYKLNVNKRRKL
jgi:hypothetical protein